MAFHHEKPPLSRCVTNDNAIGAAVDKVSEIPPEVLLARFILYFDATRLEPFHEPPGQVISEAAGIDEIVFRLCQIEQIALERGHRAHGVG